MQVELLQNAIAGYEVRHSDYAGLCCRGGIAAQYRVSLGHRGISFHAEPSPQRLGQHP